MPALELMVEQLDIRGLPEDGNLILEPPIPGLNRVLLRRLICWLRVPPIPGTRKAIIDTGSPLTLFPYKIWHDDFRWRAGRDYDELKVAGNPPLHGQIDGYRFNCRLARLRVPVELAGRDLKAQRLRLDSLVCQLAERGGPPFVILGLWGGVFTGRRLAVDPQPAGGDDLSARLGF
jgi:hypothetical protein